MVQPVEGLLEVYPKEDSHLALVEPAQHTVVEVNQEVVDRDALEPTVLDRIHGSLVPEVFQQEHFRRGVQLMLRQPERESRVLGMTTVISFFQAVGHLLVRKTALKILRGNQGMVLFDKPGQDVALHGGVGLLGFLQHQADLLEGYRGPALTTRGEFLCRVLDSD